MNDVTMNTMIYHTMNDNDVSEFNGHNHFVINGY